jgi:hypothetical protein
MEPLLDKLAHQKPVRMIFAAIRGCDGQSDSLAHKLVGQIKSHPRITRFILVSVGITFVGFLLFTFLAFGVFNFGDSDLPTYHPDTTFEKIFDGIWGIILLPLIILGFVYGKFGANLNPPGIIVCFFLFTPGLFWATVVELLFKLKKRRIPGAAPEPDPKNQDSSLLS